MSLKTAVRAWKGRPTLFINDQPHTGLMHWRSKPDDAAGDIALLAGAGIDLMTTGMGGAAWAKDGAPDFRTLEKRMRMFVEAHPGIMVMPRIHLRPPAWWLEQHPDEVMRNYNLDTNEWQPGEWAAITSEAWRRGAEAALAPMIEHLEANWGDHILGYQPGSGDCGEYSYHWGFPRRVLSDYSEPHVRAFRGWLNVRYGGDVERLRAAWKMETDFETAAVPPPARRVRDRSQSSLLDPAEDRWVIDYNWFHSEAMTDCAIWGCRLIKDALRRLGREKICGVYFGYHHFEPGEPQLFFNSGHHAHQPLLESAVVDFLAAPNYYPNRQSGGSYASQLLPASVRLHGKLYYSEEDTGTHLAHEGWWGFVCRDAEMSASVLRRNLLGVLQDGGTQWWMDWGGTGWYRDETLLGEISALREFAEECLETGYTSAAQIAVFVSDTSAASLRYDAGLKDALVERQLEELTAIGAPFDVYRLGDLERLAEDPSLARYRLVLFLDTLQITARERQLIRERLAADNRTLLWVYAPGLVQENEWDAKFVEDLTGMRLRLQRSVRHSLLAETWLTGRRLVYGATSAVGPVMIGIDPDATIAGFQVNSTRVACPERGDEPALLIKELDGWRSVWSAAPCLPADLLQVFAREAGVHLYGDRGDQIFAGAGWLGLHARVDGALTIRLPQCSRVVDGRAGKVIADGAEEFTIASKRGETYRWKIKAARS
jgi:hypothetical protein